MNGKQIEMEANRDLMIDHMTTARGILLTGIVEHKIKKHNLLDWDRSIEIINNFIKINNDRIDGYRTASDQTEDATLKALLFECLKTSITCKEELIAEIDELGGVSIIPENGEGPFFKAWMHARALFSGHNRQTILAVCLHGEELVEEAYHHLLTNTLNDISDELRSILNAQYDLLNADMNRIKSLLLQSAVERG